MENEEILYNAIYKAVKNGYNYDFNSDETVFYLDKETINLNGYYSLIFDKDFAKAFWGSQLTSTINISHPLNKSFGKTEYNVA